MVISFYARQGAIIHTRYDLPSVVRSINDELATRCTTHSPPRPSAPYLWPSPFGHKRVGCLYHFGAI